MLRRDLSHDPWKLLPARRQPWSSPPRFRTFDGIRERLTAATGRTIMRIRSRDLVASGRVSPDSAPGDQPKVLLPVDPAIHGRGAPIPAANQTSRRDVVFHACPAWEEL